MSDLSYTDFVIEFENEAGAYAVSIESPLSGEVLTEFRLPFAPLELENFLLRLGVSPGRTVRSATSPELTAAKDFGKKLYDALFQGDARAALKSALDDAAQHPDHGVRLQFRFRDTPELAALPWEFLYRPSSDTFFALSSDTPIVRYVELPEPVRTYPVKLPLRALAMAASPTDYETLDVAHEKQKLMDALRQSKFGDLIARGIVQVDWLERATLAALTEKLGNGDYHFLHFIGHGGVQDGEGVLILENEAGRGRAVTGSEIGQILRDERSLQLVVLNACEGATMPGPNEFASTALAMIRQGMPAVIAMQFVISDEAAKVFAGELFHSVLEGSTLDVALTNARRAIFSDTLGTEWATPVLYTRAPGKKLFDIDASNVVPVPVPEAIPAAGNVPVRGGRIADVWNTHRFWMYGGMAVILLFLIGIAASALLRGQNLFAPGAVTPVVITATPFPTNTTQPTLIPLVAVPKGKLIFNGSLDDRDGIFSYDLDSRQAVAIPLEKLRLLPDGFVNAFAVSNDGRRLAFSALVAGSKFRIGVVNLDGSGLQRAEQDDGPYTDEIPQWSPDDTKIAFNSSLDSHNPDSQEVYVMDANGKNRRRISVSSADSRYPDWSPDGTQLVYAEGAQSDHDLVKVNLQDNHPAPLVGEPKWNEVEPVWSPRGDKIAYTARNDTNTLFQVRVFDLATGGVAILPCPTNFCLLPVWSPDGSLIAFIARNKAEEKGEPYYTDPSGKFAIARFAPGILADNRIAWGPGANISLATPTFTPLPTETSTPPPTQTETVIPTALPTATPIATP